MLQIPAASDLSEPLVRQLREVLAGVVEEEIDDVDLRRGEFNELVLHPYALLASAISTAIDTAVSQLSLSEIISNPETSDTDAVDVAMANFNLTRREAVAATGYFTVVTSSNAMSVIPAKTTFTAGGMTFITTAPYFTRQTTGQVSSSQDVVFRSIGSGQYACEIPATAVTAGAASNIAAGTMVTAVSPAIANYVRAAAYASFTGGVDAESNVEIVQRQQTGLAAKVWSSRKTIDAVVRQEVPEVVATSVVGFGDAEMLRDKHALWPVAAGNRADLYISAGYEDQIVSVTATLTNIAGSDGTWQVNITRDIAPGFYEVVRFAETGLAAITAGYAVVSDTRGYDITNLTRVPDINAALEAVYSPYQTAVITFVAPLTGVSTPTINVSTKTFDAVIRACPSLTATQDLWLTDDYRPLTGDVVVKAAVPCFVSASITLNVQSPTAVDVAAYIQEVVSRIHGVGFTGALGVNVLVDAAMSVPGLVFVSSTSLFGRLRKPDGTSSVYNVTTSIVPTADTANMVSSKTVAFLTDASQVNVTLAQA